MKYRVFATDFFSKKIKNYSRKYHQVFRDYMDFLGEIEIDPYSENRLRGCIGAVFKGRMASRDLKKGKSGGFRVIYLVNEAEKSVFLITLYPKNEQENIQVNEVNKILKKTGLVK